MASTTIRLVAHPGRKNVDRGFTSTEIAFSFAGNPPTRTVQITRLDEIARAVSAFGAELRTADPGASFAIMVTVAKSQRKPRGFDAGDKADAFGEHAFLRSDVGSEALHRKLMLPSIASAA